MKRKEKLIGLFMVLFTMISVNAWSHDTHYGKVTVTSAGNGSVYVSTSQTAPDSNSDLWKDSNELTQNCGGSGLADSKTYYLHAKPNKGYRFAGWTGDKTSSNNPYRFSQSVKGTESVPNHDRFTATFEPIPTYISTAIAMPSANGKVYVSKSNTAPTEYSSETYQDSTHTVVYGQTPKHTYYYYAQSNNDDEYEFVGWSTSADGSIESSNNPYRKEITSSTGDGTTVTLYAIFAQKFEYRTMLNAVGGVGGSVNITSTSDITTEPTANGMSASSVTKQVNAPRIAYTITATAASGYQFSGWYRDAALSNRASQNASYTVNIDAKTDVAEATQTYYAKFEQLHDYYEHVFAKAVGEGLVYLGNSRNPNASLYDTEFDIPNKVNQVNAPANSTYFWIAKEVDGYNFKGWYDNEACEGDPVSTNTSYNKSISASVDEDVVNALYAKFVPYDIYYSSVTVVAQEGGLVFVGNGESEPGLNEYGTQKTFSQNRASKSAPNLSYTLYAQANPGYEFKGWVYNNGNPSTNNTVSFAANSTNESAPTARTYTAVFAEKDIIWNWEKPTLAAGSTEKYYIYNPTADKFLGNNNSGVNAEEANVWNVTTNEDGTTCTIKDGANNELVVMRKNGSATLNANNFSVNSGIKNETDQPISDTFWYKSTNNGYTLNVYIKYYSKLTGLGSDQFGDVYVGMNGTNLAPSTSQNATGNHWYFVTEEEMAAYKEYVAAYNRAVEIVTEIPEWGETKNTLNEIINANVPSQLSTSETNIAALNKIQKANMTISPAAQYGTFVAPFEVTIPEGVIAYAIESTTGTTTEDGIVTFSPVEGETLAAGTPVVVNKAGGLSSTTFYGLATTTKEEVEGNGLVGVLVDGKNAPENSYVINYIDGKVAFYIVKSEISVPKNRCYLKSGASLAKLNIIFNDATSISSTNTTETSISAIYSASGARINTLQKGVNIIKMSDGSVKKVLVK